MHLVVGLGNPGPGYAGTRHNAGFEVVRALARRERADLRAEPALAGELARARAGAVDLALLLPTTFMNRAGESVRAAVEAFAVDPARELLVVYDDLDLPLGRLRLRARGGCGGHRGMESVAHELGREDFPRLRFGIGRPKAGADVVEWVLSRFTDAERGEVDAAVERAVDAVRGVWTLGLDRAMERFNRVPESDADEGVQGRGER